MSSHGGKGGSPKVAVVLHLKKVGKQARAEVRQALKDAGVETPIWSEVPKSRKARKTAKQAVKHGAEVVIAWGGDGTVQRCVDAVAGRTKVTLAILPAGTSNLLANALRIPESPADALRVALEGERKVLDTGTVNGESFAVVAGAGLDALLMRDTGSDAKARFGKAAYVYTGVTHLGFEAQQVEVEVDGHRVFHGKATTVLVGNTREAFGGMEIFDESQPDDGVMEVGVVTAEGPLQWIRAVARTVVGHAEDSPFIRTNQGSAVRIRFERPVPYELDGGDRDAADSLEIEVEQRSLRVAVPEARRCRVTARRTP